MADWKQIQARIRRARTGADPVGQLQKLFEKTRDAMAAFELGRHLETAGQTADAARWYATAALRFRRADWKKKAEESSTRLGGGEPFDLAAGLPPPPAPASEPTDAELSQPSDSSADSLAPPLAQDSEAAAAPQAEQFSTSSEEGAKRRRRGRRGGRNRRRRSGGDAAAPVPAPPAAEPAFSAPPPELPATPRSYSSESSASAAVRARSGDPALSSRMAHLEMQLRRLLASPQVPMDSADRAPAGPGVFLVSDSDQTTHYYAEACRTLRIGIANLLRPATSRSFSSAARGTGEPLKARFADHLGITEARVSKYLNDHCVVRWLQLDDDSANFAHFLIAILQPVLNE